MQRTISVIANPFHFIDKHNRPAGVVPMVGAHGRYIGAMLDDAATSATRSDEQMARSGGKAVFNFIADADGKLKVQKLPADPMFLGGIANSVRDGALIAADVESAAMVGITAKEFVDPYKQLKAEREAAVQRLQAEGRPAGKWATDDKFFAPPAEPAAAAQDQAAQAEPAQAAEPKAEAAEPAPKPQRKSAEKDSSQ